MKSQLSASLNLEESQTSFDRSYSNPKEPYNVNSYSSFSNSDESSVSNKS